MSNESEQGVAADAQNAPEGAAKTFTQAEVDRIISERLNRPEIREAQQRLADLGRENQSLEQRLASLEKAASEATVVALRYRVAAEHEISRDDADLFLTGADEATLTAQAKRLGERITAAPGVVPGISRSPIVKASDESAFVRELFGDGSST